MYTCIHSEEVIFKCNSQLKPNDHDHVTAHTLDVMSKVSSYRYLVFPV